MVECEYNAKKDFLAFKCPNCGHADIIYLSVPTMCYFCYREYTLNMLFLATKKSYRIKYFHGEVK